MDQQLDLSALDGRQLDPEVFRRVWSRVMPDQKNSPLVVGPSPASKPPTPKQSMPKPSAPKPSTPKPPTPVSPPSRPKSSTSNPPKAKTAPSAPAVPAVPTAPSPVPCPSLCLGEDSRADAEELAARMNQALELQSAALVLAQRGRNRTLNSLAADHRRAFRQLSASYFLITGQRHRPAAPTIPPVTDLPLALRDQFVREQRWARDCRQAADAACDPCLSELYQELARDGTLHASLIRSLLEQM